MGIFSAFASMANTIANQEIAEQNLQFQKEAYNWNKEFQQSQFDYQKELNNLQMQREDSAIQRQAADYQKAGFNRLLATNGQGSASGGMSTFSGGGNLQAPQKEHAKIDMTMLDEIQYAQQAANIGQTRAQTKLIQAQANNEQAKKDNIEMNTLLQEAQKATSVQQLEEIKKRIDKMKSEKEAIDYNLGIARDNGLIYGADTRFSNPWEAASTIMNMYIAAFKKGEKPETEASQKAKQSQSDRNLRAQLWKEYKSELKRNKWTENDLRFEQYLKNRGYDTKIGL